MQASAHPTLLSAGKGPGPPSVVTPRTIAGSADSKSSTNAVWLRELQGLQEWIELPEALQASIEAEMKTFLS
jgi:hypothetical protein